MNIKKGGTREAVELWALAEGAVNMTQLSEQLLIQYGTVRIAIQRMVKKGTMIEVDAPTPPEQAEPAPCPTCGHVPPVERVTNAGPKLKYYALSDARRAELDALWTDEAVAEAIEELTNDVEDRKRWLSE